MSHSKIPFSAETSLWKCVKRLNVLGDVLLRVLQRNKTNKIVWVCVRVCVEKEKREIYYKGLAHVIMETDE